MASNSYKKIKELIKEKKAENQLSKLFEKENKVHEKDRKAFDKETAKAAKAIMNRDGKKDPHSHG